MATPTDDTINPGVYDGASDFGIDDSGNKVDEYIDYANQGLSIIDRALNLWNGFQNSNRNQDPYANGYYPQPNNNLIIYGVVALVIILLFVWLMKK